MTRTSVRNFIIGNIFALLLISNPLLADSVEFNYTQVDNIPGQSLPVNLPTFKAFIENNGPNALTITLTNTSSVTFSPGFLFNLKPDNIPIVPITGTQFYLGSYPLVIISPTAIQNFVTPINVYDASQTSVFGAYLSVLNLAPNSSVVFNLTTGVAAVSVDPFAISPLDFLQTNLLYPSLIPGDLISAVSINETQFDVQTQQSNDYFFQLAASDPIITVTEVAAPEPATYLTMGGFLFLSILFYRKKQLMTKSVN